MRIGVPTEVKSEEFRVAPPRRSTRAHRRRHQVAAAKSGRRRLAPPRRGVRAAGATLVAARMSVEAADLVLRSRSQSRKSSADAQRPGAVHLPASWPRAGSAPMRCCSAGRRRSRTRPCGRDGSLPLLAPMSEVADAWRLRWPLISWRSYAGWSGRPVGRCPGRASGQGADCRRRHVGMSAALIALGLQADVTLMDKNVARLREATGSSAARSRRCSPPPTRWSALRWNPT